jgi:DNA-binding transcriptional LysR family regulator
MHYMNQFLKTSPFDLYELALFRLVVTHGSFTKAAQLAGLTQSAITRQIQGVENNLGIKLLERTTRSVHTTPAGRFLYDEASRLLGDVDQSLTSLAQQFGNARKEVRVSVSRSIGLAYLPGFFHANLRRFPKISYRVACQTSPQILASLEANEQDLGMICPPPRLPKTLRIIHEFQDDFTLVVPAIFSEELKRNFKPKIRVGWLRKQNWLLVDERSNTGRGLRLWMQREGWHIDPAMHLDNFDLIINLVSLGMGISFVPIRALALYNQRQKITRVDLSNKFSRKLVVVVRKHRPLPLHIEQFIQNILF